ncbi:MAG: PIG-L family deacetylase [Actinobacteria bacterium]|nr:PIG-L family deacetylase [Actinomycetota bacterium]
MLIKYRKIIIAILILWTLWFLGLGALGGWFLSRGRLDKFQDLDANDRIMVIAPHIDDETISSGGLIQQAQKIGAKVKIVYITNGDNNIRSVIKEDKTLKLNPNEFIALGEQRMREGEKATGLLGLTKENLIFLGFPDDGLYLMLNKYYDPNTPLVSRGTKFTFNPYSGTYKSQQSYTGSNIVIDLEEILKDFNPSIIIVPHPRDKNLDHRATYLLLEKALSEIKIKPKVFTYLIHYPQYPPLKNLALNEFLYPPEKLFSQAGWFSYNLSTEQEKIKLEAIKQYVSQRELGNLYDLIISFAKKNEIFEEIE